MTVLPVTLLVVAKAPVPGLAKTRLAAAVGERRAAHIAAAALLDTLDAVAATPVAARVVALTGDIEAACRADALRGLLAGFTVVDQRGATFAERLVHAHADAAAASGFDAVLQIGMDTPQVSAALLESCARELDGSHAVLGPAHDGGWWLLGVPHPDVAHCLIDVPMSHPATGSCTREALQRNGVAVRMVDGLADVDTLADIPAVRVACAPSGRFAAATADLAETSARPNADR